MSMCNRRECASLLFALLILTVTYLCSSLISLFDLGF